MNISEIKRKIVKYFPLRHSTFKCEAELDLGNLVECPKGYHPTNPAVLELDGNLLVAVRLVNYLLHSDNLTSSYFTDGEQYHSLYRFILVDNGGKLLKRLDKLDSYFEGREDVRLLKSADEIYAVYTENDYITDSSRIAYTRLDFSLNVIASVKLESPFGFRVERNWSPFIRNNNLHFVYSLDPLLILTPAVGGAVVPVNTSETDSIKSRMSFFIKGSSPGEVNDSGWTFVFHRRKTQMLSRKRQIYVSYFVTIGRDFQSVKIGRPFSIGKSSVQFVCGLIANSTRVIISYGRADKKALLLFPKASEIDNLVP